MTKLGIVGAEAKKFTDITEDHARREIRRMIKAWSADLVISGHSPLGGIDWWAIEEADKLGCATREYPPRVQSWVGYRARNLAIARNSDVVVCMTVRQLPPDYDGLRFPEGCYHCQKFAPHFGGTAPDPEDHVKSGGCWTMWQAAELGKQTALVVIG